MFIVRWNKIIKDNKIEKNNEEVVYKIYNNELEIKGKKEELDKYLSEFNKNEVKKLLLKLTARKLKESVKDDLKIINAISEVKELDEIINLLSERLREFCALYFPEIMREKNFVDLVLEDKEKVMLSLGIKESVGGEFDKEDLERVRKLAKLIKELKNERFELLKYIEKKRKKFLIFDVEMVDFFENLLKIK